MESSEEYFWSGLLFLSDRANPNDEISCSSFPVSLSRCDEMLGKRFCSIASSGETFILNCSDGSYSIDADARIEKLESANFIHVSSGKEFTIGISQNHHLYSWGCVGAHGQLGQGCHVQKLFHPLEIQHKSKFISCSSGESFTIALTAEGQAYAWGANFHRQLGIYSKSPKMMSIQNAMVEEMIFTPRLIPLSLRMPIQKVVCGSHFSMAISKDGKLFSWGAGESGQLGTTRCTLKDVPSVVDFSCDSNVIDVACGVSHVIALLANDSLFGWGLNQRGQLGVGDLTSRSSPTLISKSIQAAKVFSHDHSSAAIDRDGRLWTWGSSRSGRLLHSTEHVIVEGEFTRIVGCVATPTLCEIPQILGSRCETICFTPSRVGLMVKTTLTAIWPDRGPKRSFGRLYIRGFGLWSSEQIIVRFSSKIPSIYNPPRSCTAKLLEANVLVCKPPKFSETGTYSVDISLDGGIQFLPRKFEIFIYKEVFVTSQEPKIIDLRRKTISNLILRGPATLSVLNSDPEYQAVKIFNLNQELTPCDTEDHLHVRLSFLSLSEENEENAIQFTVKAKAHIEMVATSEGEDAEKESELVISINDLDLSQLKLSFNGLYELRSVLSFNDQDFAPLVKETPCSLCHAFSPQYSSPSSYPLANLPLLAAEMEIRTKESLEKITVAHDSSILHSFERKISIHGESLFPSSRLPRGVHIMAVACRCIAESEDKSNLVDFSDLSMLEGLLVHGESTSLMHFIVNVSFLRALHGLLLLQNSVDLLNCCVTVEFSFFMETARVTGVERVELSTNAISLLFFSPMKIALSRSLFPQEETSSTVVICKENGEGFSCDLQSSIVRIHCAKHVLVELSSSLFQIIDDSLDESRNEVCTAAKIKVSLPSWTDLQSSCDRIGLSPSDFFVSFSLDGISIPPQVDWKRIYFYSKLSSYSVHTPLPKGGFPAASMITLQLRFAFPSQLIPLLRIRLRGREVTMTTPPYPVTLTENAGDDEFVSSFTFALPDASTLGKVSPVTSGKEKLYFVDMSPDNGTTFDLAEAPQIQIK